MTINVEVKCINKTDRQSVHERIKNIGGVNHDGTRWKLSETEAIAGIKRGEWKFYVTKGGNTVWVVIVKTATGHEYLKTQADGEIPNNLLSLPECP
jgi:hypothetical protein